MQLECESELLQELNAGAKKPVHGYITVSARRGDGNSVPMGGMLIDTLAYQFMETWAYREKSYLYYGYLTRDFFHFLANQASTQQYWLAPGSGSYVYRKGTFEYKARQAELRVLEALEYIKNGHDGSAKQKFREIYGTDFPA
jgi:hypothetical protein